ncbi:AraC family transcriptional regulator [Marinirhabdus gelatinilytica]|uniref:Tetratricopeptide repeat protein n=1 Tax=Marinirhabdus gelatinilytica TaxID=1703343 RepID=A0A370Q512_9FLAO|nr:AraC family transcriptional regulator [Marinirhabdus gelatinilytica]RDK83466.1 tetratricopeptide repeat protein [Marinirhabdus gelatinilytica]
MRLSVALVVCSIFFSLSLKCQEVKWTEATFIKNLSSVYEDPDQTIKVANYILENASSSSAIVQSHYLISQGELVEGNAVESVRTLFKARDNFSRDTSPFAAALVYSELSERYALSGMNTVADRFNMEAQHKSDAISSAKEKAVIETVIALSRSHIFSDTQNNRKSLQRLQYVETNFTEVPEIYSARIYNRIAALHGHLSNLDSARVYYEKALRSLEKSGAESSTISAIAYYGLGNVYLEKDALETSKKYYTQALSAPYIDNATKFSTHKALSEIYKKQDSTAMLQKYNNKNVLLHPQIQDSERNVRSALISYLQQEQEDVLKIDKTKYYSWVLLLVLLFGLIFLGYYFYNRKLNKEYERFKQLIAEVEKDKKLEVPYKVEEVNVKPTKAIVIPDETIQGILERLEEFEKSTKFTDSKMNLTVLAKQLKSNSKYISEIIRTHKQKNFNSYINELRINYIIKLMKTDKAYLNYKVSYLAESSGFSSHSAFTVVFKNITGFTPKQFITFLKKSKKENLQN